MNRPNEISSGLKLVFAGSMGAGKTTAIRAISEIEPISTEVENSDRSEFDKVHTTVAMDYGEVTLASGEKLGLYGTPGQLRFDFMWEIVATGALGIVVLIDNSRPDPMADLTRYLSVFRAHAQIGAIVVAIGRMDTHPTPNLADYSQRIEELQLIIPIMPADVRIRGDVIEVLEVLFHQIEATDDSGPDSDDWMSFITNLSKHP